MRFFALETDTDKLNRSFLSRDEHIVLTARFHGFLFFLRALGALIVTLLLIAAVVGGARAGVSLGMMSLVAGIAWIFLAGRQLFRAFIDWQFDELVVTTEKIVTVNQSNVFRQEIHQMNLENLASVKCRTQYGGLVRFGQVCFELKEGTGASICLRYIPQANRVCSIISDVLVQFQRR